MSNRFLHDYHKLIVLLNFYTHLCSYLFFLDGFIEMGAQWVHGSAPNPILELLDSLGEIDNSYQCEYPYLYNPNVYLINYE